MLVYTPICSKVHDHGVLRKEKGKTRRYDWHVSNLYVLWRQIHIFCSGENVRQETFITSLKTFKSNTYLQCKIILDIPKNNYEVVLY